MADSDIEQVADAAAEKQVLGDEGGDYIEFRVAAGAGEYTWHRKAQNHEIISRGESHPRKDEALRAAKRANQPIWSLVSDEALLAEFRKRAKAEDAAHPQIVAYVEFLEGDGNGR